MSTNDIGRGYDCGYRSCPCFWGTTPSALVQQAAELVRGTTAIDAGCGEGKNAAYLASIGYRVKAIDASEYALRNALRQFSDVRGVEWLLGDASELLSNEQERYDVGVSTGVVHCLKSTDQARRMLELVSQVLKPTGALAFASFNDSVQDLSGHEPEFQPLLIPHDELVQLVEAAGFRIVFESNSILNDLHPHIGIPHQHSITRIVGLKAR